MISVIIVKPMNTLQYNFVFKKYTVILQNQLSLSLRSRSVLQQQEKSLVYPQASHNPSWDFP